MCVQKLRGIRQQMAERNSKNGAAREGPSCGKRYIYQEREAAAEDGRDEYAKEGAEMRVHPQSANWTTSCGCF
jgi:hypothetical protein